MTVTTFSELELDENLLEALQDKGFTRPTAIQAAAIPPALDGRDILGSAPTGTGKTAAYLLPALQHLLDFPRKKSGPPRILILTPTRELAMQVADHARELAKHTHLDIATITGGVAYMNHAEVFSENQDIVVATTGRLLQYIKEENFDCRAVETLILDEADRMLDMGFIHDVTRILDKIPSRQNLGMFSATISREVMDISWVYQRDPEEITVQATKENKPDILQYRLEVPSDGKVDAIARILNCENYERVICFCNTKGSTERLTKFLQMRGVDAQCIHGDIPQRKREEVMQRFRDGKLRVFVATDVASRGIDVDDVDAVFNYEVPEENEYYIHRIGRTGRAKKHGVAYTLLSDFPSRLRLDTIARNTRSTIVPAQLGDDGSVTPASK